MRKSKFTIAQRTKSQSRSKYNASQQTLSKGKSFSLADMTTDAQLKRYEQLNQLQASRCQIPQSQKTMNSQKRFVIPFSK